MLAICRIVDLRKNLWVIGDELHSFKIFLNRVYLYGKGENVQVTCILQLFNDLPVRYKDN